MKFQKSLYVISVLLLVSGLTLMTTAQRRNASQGSWQYLGESNVDGTRDHDTIRVNSREAFRAIQLRIQGGEIEFQRVVVHFENGADSDVEFRDRIRVGGQTRAIDLPGDNRRIDSVEIWYSKGNWGRRNRPNLKLYGLAGGYNMSADPQRRNASQESWQYLGESNVDGTRDHDTIRVNSREAFRAIQLRIQGGEIEFQRVVVHFENGADSEVEIRDRIRAGGQTRAIDLPGDNRRIDNVEIWYGKGNWGRSRPNLKLYGLVSIGGPGRERNVRGRDDSDLNRPVQTVYCESGDMKRHWCSEGIGRRVTLIRQRSTSPCVQGRTWGVDRSGIWVDRGCRADFEVR